MRSESVGHLLITSIGGSMGAPRKRIPWGSKFFHFHAVFGKDLQKIGLWELAPPPQENPGSATDIYCNANHMVYYEGQN